MIKILAVDDEQGICNLIKDTFAPIGFTVLSANNGKDALKIIAKDKPKLVFLDIRMMGMSGLEVLKEIKEADKTIKVVMLTVMNDEATKLKAKELGADDFVIKPFMSEHLEEVASREIADLMKQIQIQKPKILVADDEEDVRARLAELISRHFVCDIEQAENGQQALDKLHSNKFDIAF